MLSFGFSDDLRFSRFANRKLNFLIRSDTMKWLFVVEASSVLLTGIKIIISSNILVRDLQLYDKRCLRPASSIQ